MVDLQHCKREDAGTPRTGIFTGMMSLESLALDKALRAALQVPAAILMVLILSIFWETSFHAFCISWRPISSSVAASKSVQAQQRSIELAP